MSISIRNPKAEELAREAGKVFNLSMTDVIIEALEEKLKQADKPSEIEALRLDQLLKISTRCTAMTDLDTRTPDEILGYNSEGVF